MRETQGPSVGEEALVRALAMAGLLVAIADRAEGRVTARAGRLADLEAVATVGSSLERLIDSVADEADRARLGAALTSARGEGRAFETTVRVRTADGDGASVRVAAEALDAARLVITFTRTEAAGRSTDDAAKLRAIVSNSPDAIYVRNLADEFVLVNPAGLLGLGLTEAEVLGRRPEEVMPPMVASKIHESDQRVLESGETLTYESPMRNRAGGEATYLISKYVYRSASGEAIGLIGIMRDISEIKRLQLALAEQNAQLQRIDRRKSEFVSSLSHELRTPLTFIKGYVEFLEDLLGGPLTDTQAEYVAAIQQGVVRLERLVNDLLDFARMDAGTFTLQKAPADLRQTIERTVAVLQPMLDHADVQARLELPEEPVRATIDDQRIAQVVTNLVTNAIKVSPRHAAIAIRVRSEGDRVVCEVEDAGPGLTADEQQRLFRRFSQLEAGRERGGLGLGLSIAKALVEAHGGTIGVTSRPAEGATFWFSLPTA